MNLNETNYVVGAQAAGYTRKFISGSRLLNTSYGQLCLVKNEREQNLNLIAHNANDEWEYEERDTCEFSLYKYRFGDSDHVVSILLVYKHPKMAKIDFFNSLHQFYGDAFFNNENENPLKRGKIVVLGDFNIDFNNQDGISQNILNEMDRTMGLKPLLSNQPSHDAGRQIDWIFSNIRDKSRLSIDAITYDTWFSDHKPLWSQISVKK
jgi:exonuclease III